MTGITHNWPAEDQCEIGADSFGTKCTDLATWLVAGHTKTCTSHLPLALGMETGFTNDGKVTVEHYTS